MTESQTQPIKTQWVIYRCPADYPENYVVRKWEIHQDGIFYDAKPFAITHSLAEARGALPAGLTRKYGNHPHITAPIEEVWM